MNAQINFDETSDGIGIGLFVIMIIKEQTLLIRRLKGAIPIVMMKFLEIAR